MLCYKIVAIPVISECTHLYLSDEVVLEVGNASHHPLALLTPVQVHDGQLSCLTTITWLQPETNSSILWKDTGGGRRGGEGEGEGSEEGEDGKRK